MFFFLNSDISSICLELIVEMLPINILIGSFWTITQAMVGWYECNWSWLEADILYMFWPAVNNRDMHSLLMQVGSCDAQEFMLMDL